MSTDAEIIRVLAEKVMGATPTRDDRGIGSMIYQIQPHKTLQLWSNGQVAGWNPLESWSDAGMVLDKMRAKGLFIEVTMHDGRVSCSINHDPNPATAITEISNTGPRAISLAAYRAVTEQSRGERPQEVDAQGQGRVAE